MENMTGNRNHDSRYHKCPVYNEIRKEHFVNIKGTVITTIGFDSWKRNLNKKDIIDLENTEEK
jgi:hypothetical protein